MTIPLSTCLSRLGNCLPCSLKVAHTSRQDYCALAADYGFVVNATNPERSHDKTEITPLRGPSHIGRYAHLIPDRRSPMTLDFLAAMHSPSRQLQFLQESGKRTSS